MSQLHKNDEVCSVCEAEPEDILILSCRHNLCLDCATEIYNLNTKDDQIVCEICLAQTKLDEDTIVCLRSLSAKNIKQSHTMNGAYDFQFQQNRLKFPPIPKSTYSNYAKLDLPLIQQESHAPRCQKHNEPLTYYCLQCNFFKICSECMLSQNHRYHKVITLKKASVHIKDTIQKVGRQKLKLKNLLEKDRESLIIRRQESQKQLQVNINELKCTFDDIIKLLMDKYENLKKHMEEEAGRKLEIMQGAINQIEKKITLIEQTIQFEDELIKSVMDIERDSGNMFQMFEYYESQMSQNRVDFEPSLPNFISEVTQQKLYGKQKIFARLEQITDQFIVSSTQIEDQASDQNINYISQIENEQYLVNQVDYVKENTKYQNSTKRNSQEIQNEMKRHLLNRPNSQNINIIQLNSAVSGQRQKKSSNMNLNQQKRPKQSIQAIKRKARQNLKDRQLSHSRKMQLSRSIQNATDILNKIQQRSSRI